MTLVVNRVVPILLFFLCVSGGALAQSQIIFKSTDDAYVQSDRPRKNTGSLNQLRLRKTRNVEILTYIKFNVTGLSGSVVSAKLRLKVLDGGRDGGTIFLASNDFQGGGTPWHEGSIKFRNAPPTIGNALSSVGSVSIGDIVEFDVTAAVTADAIYSFCIKNFSSNVVKYSSNQGSAPPKLVIELGPGGNLPPVANAGPNQTVTDADNNGSETVTLDGSASSDPDGAISSYVWTEGTVPIATGVNPSVALGLGTHAITLTITDNAGATATDQLVVNVHPPGTILTLSPTDDALVNSRKPDKNYGSAPDMRVRTTASAKQYSFLKFNVSGLLGAVLSAKIRLQVIDGSSDGGSIYPVANTWDEGSLIWRNAPAITGSPLSSAGAVATGDLVELDVTSAITGNGTFSFGMKNSSSDAAWFSSKEGTTPPELIIEVATTTNASPVANAGPDQTVTDADNNGSETVTLDGSASFDPDGTIASYVWNEGTVQIATGVNPTVTLGIGTHTVTLAVTDNDGTTSSDELVVTVQVPTSNQPPVANAGPDQTVTDADNNGSETITLDGSASSDPDGTITSYVWNEGTVQIATGVNPTVTLGIGTHTITLTITDNEGATGSDQLVVNVNPSGTSLPPGTTLTLNPTDDALVNSRKPDKNYGGGPDMRVRRTSSAKQYSFLKFNVSGLLSPVLSAKIRLRVLDGSIDAGSIYPVANTWDEGSLIWRNAPAITGSPLSSAGAAASGDLVELDVTAAVTGNGTFSFGMKNASSDAAWFSSKEGTAPPELIIEVAPNPNAAPVANAGPDQTVTDADNNGSESVILDGSASSDPDGSIASYAWNEGTVQIATGVNPSVALGIGTHTITLTVTDNDGATGSDQMVVTVQAPAPNQPPVANAGPDQTVTDADNNGSESVILDGSASSDPDGSIASYVWNAGTIQITTGVNPTVALGVGTHTITLTVTDNDGASSSDQMVVTVTQPANQPPIVDAGPFQTVELAAGNTVVLGATASDDGLPSSPGAIGFQWTVIALDPREPRNVPDPGELGNNVIFSPSPFVLNPTVTFLNDNLFTFRLTVTDGEFSVFDDVQILVLQQGLIPRPLSEVAVPGPDNLAAFDPNLSSEIDGNPVPFGDFIVDKAAAVKLGKALFWDMQVGSDGIQACASCHFHAGADNRFTNELNPGANGTFDLGPPNHILSMGDFPYHKLADPNNRFSSILADADDITGAMGVLGASFLDIIPGSAVDDFTTVPLDNPFNTGTFNVRRTTGRNAPTAINAVFNFRNFWDGRAFNNFNGVNPFGNRDPNAKVVLDTDGPGGLAAAAVTVCIPLSSLASQATGPPLSGFEMSADGRIWPKIGKKLLSPGIIPLGKQLVHPTDSELGLLSNSPANGLNTTYADMIKAAFNPKWWNSDNIITFNPDGSVATIGPAPPGPLATHEYTLMEANFSLIFGLAVQCYEAALVSDDAPFDRFRKGDNTALTPEQQRGLKIFTNIGLDLTVPAGLCVNCHVGPEFTAASVSLIGFQEPANAFEPPNPPEMIIERMPMALGQGKAAIDFVAGDALNPAAGTPQLPLDFDPRGKLIEIKDAGTGRTLFFGTLPGVPNTSLPPGPAPCEQEFFIAFLFPTLEVGGVTGIPDRPNNPGFLANAELTIFPNCSVEFGVQLVGLVPGFYDLFVDGIKRGTMQAVVDAIYDLGFYNIGVRPTSEDIGMGGTDPFGNPLSFAEMELLQPGRADIRKGVPGGGLGKGNELLHPAGTFGESAVVDGAFKVPTLRNIELTGPYFHNGSQATLRQVVDFYNRGGDFSDQNVANLAPDILPLGLTEQDKSDIVAFLLSLTDERVRKQSAPFDHPQLFIPNGHDPVTGETMLAELPAVGATGGPPIQPFLNGDPTVAKPAALASNDKEEDKEEKQIIPKAFALDQNFPNPFNPSTTIHFALMKEVKMRLEIYNLLGQKVRTLVQGTVPAGVHTVPWNGKDDNGKQVVSGVYIYRLQTPNFVRTRKMLMVK